MLEKFLRNVKSINMRNYVAVFHIVFPPSTERLSAFLTLVPKVLENAGFKAKMAYTHLEKNYAKSQGICNIINNNTSFCYISSRDHAKFASVFVDLCIRSYSTVSRGGRGRKKQNSKPLLRCFSHCLHFS